MTEEECRETARSNYVAQMEMLGYQTDGNPRDMVEVVRCKDCKRHLECDYWIENGNNWYCADGERKEE